MKLRKKRKDFNVQFFIEELGKRVSLNENEALTYQGFDTGEMLSLLRYMVDFPSNAEHLDKQLMTNRAIKELLIKDTFTEKAFFEELKNVITCELRTRERTFYVLTTMSLDMTNIGAHSYELLGCKISLFKDSFSDRFTGRSDVIEALSEDIDDGSDVRGYSRIEIEVKSRNENEAFSRALDSLNILRALFSFAFNDVGIILGDFYKPINKIRLGKIHTLHDHNGVALNSPVFYEPEFSVTKAARYKKPDELTRYVCTLLERVRVCKFSRKIENALIRFVTSLDIEDKNVSVVKLWGALESLVVEGEPNCDLMPSRLSVFYKDSEFAKHIAMHIREYRNEHVHQGIGDDESVHRAYHLQRFFKSAVNYYIQPIHAFPSLTEANKLLDKAALGQNKLHSELETIRRAMKFMGYADGD